MIILQCFLFVIGFLALGISFFLLIDQKKQEKMIVIEDNFFLIYLLILRLHEEIDGMRDEIDYSIYLDLKASVDRFKIDLFGN